MHVNACLGLLKICQHLYNDSLVFVISILYQFISAGVSNCVLKIERNLAQNNVKHHCDCL